MTPLAEVERLQAENQRWKQLADELAANLKRWHGPSSDPDCDTCVLLLRVDGTPEPTQ